MCRKTIESTQRISTDQKKGGGGSKIDFVSFSLINMEVSSEDFLQTKFYNYNFITIFFLQDKKQIIADKSAMYLRTQEYLLLQKQYNSSVFSL